MALGHYWAGGVAGTNTGKVFVKFEGEDTALTGSLHFNDTDVGVVVYSLTGSFDGEHLTFTGQPQTPGEQYAPLNATATLNAKGNLEGQWQTDLGTAGVFVLLPQQQGQAVEPAVDAPPEQLHTARHTFGAVQIDRDQITSLAEDIQREFKNAKVVVTVVAGTEQSRFLPDFKVKKIVDVKVVNLSYDGCSIHTLVPLLAGEVVKLSVLGRGAMSAVVRWHKARRAGLLFQVDRRLKTRWPRRTDRVAVRAEALLRRSGRIAFRVTLFDLTRFGCKCEFIERPSIYERVWLKFDGLQSIAATVCWIEDSELGLMFGHPLHPAVFELLLTRLAISGSSRVIAQPSPMNDQPFS